MYIKRVLRCTSNVILLAGNLQISNSEFIKDSSLYYLTPISNYVFLHIFLSGCFFIKNVLIGMNLDSITILFCKVYLFS